MLQPGDVNALLQHSRSRTALGGVEKPPDEADQRNKNRNSSDDAEHAVDEPELESLHENQSNQPTRKYANERVGVVHAVLRIALRLLDESGDKEHKSHYPADAYDDGTYRIYQFGTHGTPFR